MKSPLWELVPILILSPVQMGNGRLFHVQKFIEGRFLSIHDPRTGIEVLSLFFYQIAVCDYYGQYYASTAANRHIYLHQAIFSTKLLRWLEKDSAVVKSLDSS